MTEKNTSICPDPNPLTLSPSSPQPTQPSQAGYKHYDGEEYVQDAHKVPCSQYNPGQQNGICDGFGTSQCAPPYIGDDCGK